MMHALNNLVENAVSFAKSRVSLKASWSGEVVRIVIADDGPGFPRRFWPSSASPIFRSGDLTGGATGAAGGLGLGLFIANALLERSGARLDIANGSQSAPGAVASPSGCAPLSNTVD